MAHMQSVDDPILKEPTRWPYYESALEDPRTSTEG